MSKCRIAAISLAVGLILPMLLIDVSIIGCAAGSTGVARPLSDQAYTTTTNAISTATQVVTTVAPAPWAEIFRIAAGVAIAGLTAWQSWTHSRVTKLQNGQTATKQTPTV